MSPKPPKLIFALWSVRDKMLDDPAEVLDTIKEIGFKDVEIAGFFNKPAKRISEELEYRDLKVSSLHGPILLPNEDAELYIEWAIEHLNIFNTNTLVLESSPTNIKLPKTREQVYRYESDCTSIASILLKVTEALGQKNFRVSYHCYPHDFRKPIDSTHPLEYIFNQLNSSLNFGLQLDTYWLHSSNIQPYQYATYPIHSIHLNERDEKGNSCILGTFRNKSLQYVSSLPDLQNISWILENDSATPSDDLDVTEQCFNNWENYWRNVTQQNQK